MKRVFGVLKIIVLSFIILFFPTFFVFSMPPHPRLLSEISKGKIQVPQHSFSIGEIKNPRIVFDETTKQDILKVERKGLVGTVHAVMLLIDFDDNPYRVEKTFFEDLANSIALDWSIKYSGNTNKGSIREYYLWLSKGEMNLIIDVYGWFRAPNAYSYYVNNYYGLGNYPQNAQKLVEDAVELADPYVDFSEYDNDGDGYVDMLLVVHAGPGAEFTGKKTDIWSHEWAISEKYVDGVYVKAYSMDPELWQKPYDMTIGVYCHEIGHILNLPDLYDTDGSSYGLGVWSLMAYGAWNGENQMGGSPAGFDAWSKLQTGWYNAKILSNGQNVSLPPVMENGDLVAIYKDKLGGSKEYFLFENRQLEDFDSYLPKSGLLIYHVDEDRYDNTEEWYPGLDPLEHYMVALEQADGKFDLEKKNDSGDQYDPFPGEYDKDEFTPLSLPSSNYYQDYSGIIIKNIEELSDEINFDLSFNTKPLEPFSPSPNDQESNVPTNVILSWECDDPDGDELRYSVYFGTNDDPPLVATNCTSTEYHVNNLDYNTRYYWRIVANDGKGGIVSGPVWSFTTTSFSQNINITELEVPDHLIYKSSNLLKFQLFYEEAPIDIDISCDSTVTYSFDENSKILSVVVEPLKGPTTLNITIRDVSNQTQNYSKTFKVFSILSQKSFINNKALITVIEHGFDESPNSQMIKQREGVYYMLTRDNTTLFNEYLFDLNNETIRLF